MLIDDGISTIVALLECKGLFDGLSEENENEEISFSETFVNVFENGVEVNIFNYAEDDADDCFIHQASRHDDDASKFTPTGMAEYVDVAKRYTSKVPGHVAQRIANVNTCYS